MRVVIALVLMFLGGTVAANDVSIGVTRVLSSRVLNESRKISIYLPDSYRDSSSYRRYPVLYIRDGGKFFHAFTGAVQHLAADATPHIPHMIVVAIHESDRVRDSSSTRSMLGFTGKVDEGNRTSGGGEQFLRFLEQELVPYIDKELSTLPYRIYCGYSFTGLNVVDALVANSGVFDAYLMIDPSFWWDDYAPERKAAKLLQERKFNRAQLFLATTDESYPEKYFITPRRVAPLAETLERIKPAGLDWQVQRYTDESHHSMALRALYDGLTYFFRGYKPSVHELYLNPEQLERRYQTLSDRLGERFALNEGLLLFFGDQFRDSFKEPDRALRYFEMAAAAYPGSPTARQKLQAMQGK